MEQTGKQAGKEKGREQSTKRPRIGVQSTSIIDGIVLKTYKHPNYFSAIKQFDKK